MGKKISGHSCSDNISNHVAVRTYLGTCLRIEFESQKRKSMNRIVDQKFAKGMWIRIDIRHRTIHFLQKGTTQTLCGIKIVEKIHMVDESKRIIDCPTCCRLILELEPDLAKMIQMFE
jgi:hypothetical protein